VEGESVGQAEIGPEEALANDRLSGGARGHNPGHLLLPNEVLLARKAQEN
jgi:hypothetical protein